VKNQVRSPSFRKGSISRRKFLGQTAAAAIGFSIVPRRVLGGPGYVPPSDKVNIAFIGVGSQGLRVMLHFLGEPDVQGVAVCDPNKASANHPQWDTHEFCNSVRKLLGVDSGWDWLSPDQPIQKWTATSSRRKRCRGRRATSGNGSMPASEAKSSLVETSNSKAWSPSPYCWEILRPVWDKDSIGTAPT